MRCNCINSKALRFLKITAQRQDCPVFQGPAQGEGLGARPPTPDHFLKKKERKLTNKNFLLKGIFDGIRILDWRTSPKHPNL